MRHRFLVRETVLATLAMLALAVLLTAVFSSPDERPVTIAQWASADRYDFLATAASELDATSETARAGPPYVAGAGESLVAGFSPGRLAGIRVPIDPAVREHRSARRRRNGAAARPRGVAWTSCPRSTASSPGC